MDKSNDRIKSVFLYAILKKALDDEKERATNEVSDKDRVMTEIVHSILVEIFKSENCQYNLNDFETYVKEKVLGAMFDLRERIGNYE